MDSLRAVMGMGGRSTVGGAMLAPLGAAAWGASSVGRQSSQARGGRVRGPRRGHVWGGLCGHGRLFGGSDLGNATELSECIWGLRGREGESGLAWSVVDGAPPYGGTPGECGLCLLGRFCMLIRGGLLNGGGRVGEWVPPSRSMPRGLYEVDTYVICVYHGC